MSATTGFHHVPDGRYANLKPNSFAAFLLGDRVCLAEGSLRLGSTLNYQHSSCISSPTGKWIKAEPTPKRAAGLELAGRG